MPPTHGVPPGGLQRDRRPFPRWLVEPLRAVKRTLQVLASPIAHARRPPGAVSLVAFRGFGSARRVCVAGQVSEDLGERPAVPHGDRRMRLWERLRMARRLLVSREIPAARVRIRYGDDCWEAVTDSGGFFFACRDAPLPAARPPLPPDLPGPPPEAQPAPLWQPYELTLADPGPRAGGAGSAGASRGQGSEGGSASGTPGRARAPLARGTVLVMPPGARRLLVSDIDDTVVYTGVANKLRMLWRLFATGPGERSPFPGIGALYRALHGGLDGGERNPILYVSRSPWSLYPILEELFRLHRIPVGPVLLLRDWGVTYTSPLPRRAPEHKRDMIDAVLAVVPEVPAVLIGDSGQHDPEIYADVVRRHPGRVQAIYIRDLGLRGTRADGLAALARELASLGTDLVAAADTLVLARDAAARGWIAPAAVAEVAADMGGEGAAGRGGRA